MSIKHYHALLALLLSWQCVADVEQQRLPLLREAYPALYQQYAPLHNALAHNLASTPTEHTWSHMMQASEQLWKDATTAIQHNDSYDDRPLYWARLRIEKQLADYAAAHQWSDTQYTRYWQLVEETSRGRTDIHFKPNIDKRILLTGFDPFFLDRHLNQSNPSGVVALLLDGTTLTYQGITAQIETVLVPVRFADFDDGTIESLLTPMMASGEVDMVLTVSMGREAFDLEHFPAKNRSANAPDNLNHYTGATQTAPKPPALAGAPLNGPEFVEFSLLWQAMQQAKGAYPIHDNRALRTLSGKTTANTLAELEGEVSVQGSGGGYLSNEISYRSIVVRNQVAPTLPVGHIHTPRISQFDAKTNQAITEQVIEMIKLSLPSI